MQLRPLLRVGFLAIVFFCSAALANDGSQICSDRTSTWTADAAHCLFIATVDTSRCKFQVRPEHVSLSLVVPEDDLPMAAETSGLSSMEWVSNSTFTVSLAAQPWLGCSSFYFNKTLDWELEWVAYPQTLDANGTIHYCAGSVHAPLVPVADQPCSFSFSFSSLASACGGLLESVDFTLVGPGSWQANGIDNVYKTDNFSWTGFLVVAPWFCDEVSPMLDDTLDWNITYNGLHVHNPISYADAIAGNSSCIGLEEISQSTFNCTGSYTFAVPPSCIDNEGDHQTVISTTYRIDSPQDATLLGAGSSYLLENNVSVAYSFEPWSSTCATMSGAALAIEWTTVTVSIDDDDDDGNQSNLRLPASLGHTALSVGVGIALAVILMAIVTAVNSVVNRNCEVAHYSRPPGCKTSKAKSWKTVVGTENAYMNNRNRGRNEHWINNKKFGLALSGGGIRSACFSTGVLEALAERRSVEIPPLLERVDVISTVSGGGYAGTGLLTHLKDEPSVEKAVSGLKKLIKSHPRHIFSEPLELALTLLFGALYSIVLVLVIAFPLSFVMESWCSCDESHPACYGLKLYDDDDEGTYSEDDLDGNDFSVFWNQFFSVFLCPNFSAEVFPWQTLFSVTWPMLLCGTILAMLLGLLYLIYLYCKDRIWPPLLGSSAAPGGTGNSDGKSKIPLPLRAAIARILLILFVLIPATIILWETLCAVTLALDTVLLNPGELALLCSILGFVYVGLRTAFGLLPNNKPLLALTGIAMLFLAPSMILVVIASVTVWNVETGGSSTVVRICTGVTLVVGAFLILFTEVVRSALHHYYRRALVRTFYKDGKDHYLQSDVMTRDQEMLNINDQNEEPVSKWPLYLANCTVEGVRHVHDDQVNTYVRAPTTFTMSQLHYGSRVTDFRLVKGQREQPPEDDTLVIPPARLSTAMALSGAALAAQLGNQNRHNARILLALFGLNFGGWLWMENHGNWYKGALTGLGRFFTALGFVLFGLIAFDLSNWFVFTGVAILSTCLTLCIFDSELTSFVPLLRFIRHFTTNNFSSDSPYYYLSDGGHLENLGLKELVKREIDVILCIDGAEDQGRSLADLWQSLDQAKAELKALGKTLEFSFEGHEPRDLSTAHDIYDLKLSRSRCLEITYTVAEDGVQEENLIEKHILYVKALLTDNDDGLLQLYSMSNHDFPHDSTADQNYSPSKQDIYMHLGKHSVTVAPRSRTPAENDDENAHAHPSVVDILYGHLQDPNP